MLKGILLVNIGTPQSADEEDVRVYLQEFLSDPDVIKLPAILRLPLVRWIIAPRRAAGSAKKYQKIWTDQGSPLLVHTRELAKKMAGKMQLPVEVGMRYGHPNIQQGLSKLRDQGVDAVDIIPMFPQFANATTGSALAKVKTDLQKMKFKPAQLRYLKEFYDFEDYLQAVLAEVKPFEIEKFDQVLFSFHGLPESQIRQDPLCQLGACCLQPEACKRRCYRAQCLSSAKLLAERLNLADQKWSVSFQSRLGPVKWIRPYTDEVLRMLADQGCRSVLVLCPAFTTDCLETLEEISIEMKALFLAAGGSRLEVVSCPNSSEKMVATLEKAQVRSDLWITLVP